MMRYKAVVKRQLLRFGIAGVVVLVTFLGGMMWMAGYEKNSDAGARFKIQAVQLKPDRGYVWLKIHVKRSGKEDHDLMKPVRLVAGDGTLREPDHFEFAGNKEKGFSDIWFSFWMEREELKGTFRLKMNDGMLTVKNSEPVPDLSDGAVRVFKKSNWEKSWLGF